MRRQEAPMSRLKWLERLAGIEEKEPIEAEIPECCYHDPLPPDFSALSGAFFDVSRTMRLLAYGVFALGAVMLIVGILIGIKL